MSIIVAARDGDRTWFASDEKVTDGQGIDMTPFRTASPEKWVVRGKWVVALAGDVAAVHLVEQCPGLEESETIEDVRDLLRDAFADTAAASPTTKSGDSFKDFGSIGLIGTADSLWFLDESFDAEPMDLWVAGSGAYVALAVMWAWRKGHLHQDIDLKSVLAIAVEAACQFVNGCGGRISVGYVDKYGFHLTSP